ncbi:MAG TPA: hypothetical protein VHS28_02710 [Chloroflexota bacterium]|nr:hypothetical protein [Chloroflexota bacterium]
MFRTVCLVIITLVASFALFLTPASAARTFPETGFTVTNDKFLDYFDHRGGARVLGFPVSREFDFVGTRVQFFQRAVLQQTANGGVALLNILDGGLMPYTHINGSTFPAPDPAVTAGAPSSSAPNYADLAIAFVKANAPDNWQGMNTNFYKTFASTVSMQDAFPNGGGSDGLLALINLEIWGLPTSKPTMDPANSNFVYLRFQRGIMHFDKTTGLTQGILLADYMKSLITGQNLPGDLAAEAKDSSLYLQYNNNIVGGINRPEALPATNMFAAFEKDGVIVPTPVPATATPVPTSTPAPTATPMATPASMTIKGDTIWFNQQTNSALEFLRTGAPDAYGIVRRNIYTIEKSTSNSIDPANHTIRVTESFAIPETWHFNSDAQAQWFGGWMVHLATHIEQSLAGKPTNSYDAEHEALLKQKDTLSRIETDQPGMQFANYIGDVLAGRETNFPEFSGPQDPLPTPSPTPGGD